MLKYSNKLNQQNPFLHAIYILSFLPTNLIYNECATRMWDKWLLFNKLVMKLISIQVSKFLTLVIFLKYYVASW